ncbi:MAG TPA: serine/threonine-protein kinase [Jatrophihabitans sp.]|uniref:serine/threonine-protein kinase n=1 Tax=Jatrophihabitans sp. TaxID=1932789 RepID=UPI002E0B9B58|nr:serine/threonine-protein kinase [Jatrophihabitans sp.]
MTQPPPDLPGLRFERLLGSGGYSDVYLYRQQLPSRQVAVKVLRDSGLAEAQRAQFTAEANAMAGLADHPNIVPVFSAAVSADGRPFIVMMFYSRPNLAVRAASERLGVAEVLRIGIQIASAVETAHRAGILHRDIKPANLLINQFGTPGLADFGIAGQIAAIEDDPDMGVSVPWAAPEVLYATSPTSVRSDVYSLAATLWHLLVGRSPFEERNGDNSPFALMRRVRDNAPPSTGRQDVPGSLDRLLRQAMAKDPAARPPSAIDFARGLQAVEQELQLPRTEIVVTTEAGDAPTPGEGPQLWQSAPATVARPASFSPQGSAPPAVNPPPPPTTARPAAYAVQGGAPTRYAPSSAPGAARTEADGRARRGPLVLVAGGVLLVGVLAVVIGFAVTGGSGKPKPIATVSNGVDTQDAGQLGENLPPGRPTVTGTRASAGVLVFRWTYSAALPSDTFEWREVGTSRRGVVTEPLLRLSDPGGSHCVQVRVVRIDGSNASATFSPKGCVP